jgi:hypothetical protein
MKRFYVVTNKNCESNQTHVHYETFQEAMSAAEDQCKRKGQKFMVLMAVASVEPQEIPVHWDIVR